MVRIIDESEITDNLCKSSPEFNDFYQKERMKYNNKIVWIQNENLRDKNAYADVNEKDSIKECKIYFKKFPDVDDAVLIAHEIGHVIRALDNESLDFDEITYPDLAQAVRNMIEDPIVDLILAKYKFDLLGWYRKNLVPFKWELEQLNKGPVNKIGESIRIVKLTRLLRCWSLIKNQNGVEEWLEYKTTFEAKFPIIWKKSVDFYNFIEENGLDTKEKQRKILNEPTLSDFCSH